MRFWIAGVPAEKAEVEAGLNVWLNGVPYEFGPAFTATGAVTATPGTSAGNAELIFLGTGSATASSGTSAAVVLLIFSATGSGTAGAATSSTSADQVFQSTGSSTASSGTSAATTLLIFQATGSVTGSPATGSGAGDVQVDVTGTGAGTATPGTSSGQGFAVQLTAGAGGGPGVVEFLPPPRRFRERVAPPAISGSGSAIASPGQGWGLGRVVWFTIKGKGRAASGSANSLAVGSMGFSGRSTQRQRRSRADGRADLIFGSAPPRFPEQPSEDVFFLLEG